MNRNCIFLKWVTASFVLVASATLGWADLPRTGNDKNTNDKTITQIRAQVAQIDRREKSFRKVERDLEGFSTEGGDVTGWFQGNRLVKMTARYFGESGKPLFVLSTYFGFASLHSEKVVVTEPMRFYWDAAGKLVRVVDNKKRVRPSSPEIQRQAQYLTDDVAKLDALLRAPAKSGANSR